MHEEILIIAKKPSRGNNQKCFDYPCGQPAVIWAEVQAQKLRSGPRHLKVCGRGHLRPESGLPKTVGHKDFLEVLWESETVSANRVAAINPPINDTDPIRKFSIDPGIHTNLQNSAELSPGLAPRIFFIFAPLLREEGGGGFRGEGEFL